MATECCCPCEVCKEGKCGECAREVTLNNLRALLDAAHKEIARMHRGVSVPEEVA